MVGKCRVPGNAFQRSKFFNLDSKQNCAQSVNKHEKETFVSRWARATRCTHTRAFRTGGTTTAQAGGITLRRCAVQLDRAVSAPFIYWRALYRLVATTIMMRENSELRQKIFSLRVFFGINGLYECAYWWDNSARPSRVLMSDRVYSLGRR